MDEEARRRFMERRSTEHMNALGGAQVIAQLDNIAAGARVLAQAGWGLRSAEWRWAERPRTVTAADRSGSSITLSVRDIARRFGKDSARLAVRQAEQHRKAEISIQVTGYFTRKSEERAREREEREYMHRRARRERFWSGLRRVTQEAWNGGDR